MYVWPRLGEVRNPCGKFGLTVAWAKKTNGWKVLELSNHLYIYDSMLISTGYCCPCKDEVVKVKRVCVTPWV